MWGERKGDQGLWLEKLEKFITIYGDVRSQGEEQIWGGGVRSLVLNVGSSICSGDVV